jgi:hypothetical protein
VQAGACTNVSAQALPGTDIIHGEPEPVVVGHLQQLPFLTVNEFVLLDPRPPLSFLSAPPDSTVGDGIPVHDDVPPFHHPDNENKEWPSLLNPSLKPAPITDSISCKNDVASASSSRHLHQTRPRKRKAHRDLLFSNDVASVASTHSQGRLCSHHFRPGLLPPPQSVSTQFNQKARRCQSRKHLQKRDLATDLISTQPSKPSNKVEVASKVTPTKYLKNSRFDGAESELSSEDDPSTATPNIQTNASLDDRKLTFQTTSGDSYTNQHVEGNASDYNNQEDVLEAVEDTDIVYVADDNNDNNVGDSVQDYDNTEAVEGVEDTEVVSIVVDDHVEPSDNESVHDDGPGSAMGDYQQDHIINTRLPKPSMK